MAAKHVGELDVLCEGFKHSYQGVCQANCLSDDRLDVLVDRALGIETVDHDISNSAWGNDPSVSKGMELANELPTIDPRRSFQFP